ncbi:MAG: hypothetical protein HYX34_07465 [Actinobacteria bacterium]|nr:hypothetical protein [Actinomycetota bacterium]
MSVDVKGSGELCASVSRPSTGDASSLCGRPEEIDGLMVGAARPPEDPARRVLYGAVPEADTAIRVRSIDAEGIVRWVDVASATSGLAPGARFFAVSLPSGSIPTSLEAGAPGEPPALTFAIPSGPTG